MAVDDCTSTFAEMAAVVLPGDMERVRAAMAAPHPMTDFCTPRVGVRSILARLGRNQDFSGCYVLLRDGNPFYVGISRSVVQRLRQHGTGNTHFDASLAHLMASEKTGHEMTRADAMQDESFRHAFNEARQLLRDSSVAFIEISNPLELYLFEAYCALELDTGEWNTFRTH
jgi:predicted GIY-YIG superfamily endonuclease